MLETFTILQNSGKDRVRETVDKIKNSFESKELDAVARFLAQVCQTS